MFPSSTLLPSYTSKSPWQLWISPLQGKELSATLCREGCGAVSNAGVLQQQQQQEILSQPCPTSPDSLATTSGGSPDAYSGQAFPLKSSLTNFFPAQPRSPLQDGSSQGQMPYYLERLSLPALFSSYS